MSSSSSSQSMDSANPKSSTVVDSKRRNSKSRSDSTPSPEETGFVAVPGDQKSSNRTALLSNPLDDPEETGFQAVPVGTIGSPSSFFGLGHSVESKSSVPKPSAPSQTIKDLIAAAEAEAMQEQAQSELRLIHKLITICFLSETDNQRTHWIEQLAPYQKELLTADDLEALKHIRLDLKQRASQPLPVNSISIDAGEQGEPHHEEFPLMELEGEEENVDLPKEGVQREGANADVDAEEPGMIRREQEQKPT